jgi:site-specific DNA recombinase
MCPILMSGVIILSTTKLHESIRITNIINYNRKSRQDIEREKKTGEDTLSEIIKLMTGVLDKYGIPYTQKNEIGSGDKIETRPVFQGILVELENGIYDAIAVKEISRLGRGSYTDMGKIYDLIIEKRVYIITPWKIYDPQNTSDLRQIRFELFLSREEFETTRERLIGGRYSGAMQGKWVSGKPPMGFHYNDTTQKLEPDEDTTQVIKLIFDYYVNGIDGKEVSFRAIATHLKRLGFKTPNGKSEWRPIQVQRVVSNPVYIGTVRFRTSTRKGNKYTERPADEHIIVENAHEPIVDMETWELAQNKLNDKNRKIPRSKLDFSPCELASLFVCLKCGRKMVRQFSVQNYEKSNGEISKYEKEFLWCTTTACSFVKYRDAEERIIKTLQILGDLNDDLLTESIEKLTSSSRNIIRADDQYIHSQVEQRKKELNNKLKFIFEKYESGIYSDDDFLSRKVSIQKEMDELSKVRINEKEVKEKIIDVSLVRVNIKSIMDIYDDLSDKTEKNTLLRRVFQTIRLEVTEKGRGRKSAKFNIYPQLTIDIADNYF